jgi:hypothetical protein
MLVKRIISIAVVAGALAGITACGDDSPAADAQATAEPAFVVPPISASGASYVGRADDGTAFAVTVIGSRVVAYQCDGENAGVWFTGTVDPGSDSVALTSASGERATVTLGDEPAVEVDGDTPFELALEPAEAGAGLYRDVSTIGGDVHVSGWIVANDGEVTGAQTDSGGTVTNSSATPTSGRSPFGCGVLGFRINWNRARGNTQIADGMLAQFNADCANSTT